MSTGELFRRLRAFLSKNLRDQRRPRRRSSETEWLESRTLLSAPYSANDTYYGSAGQSLSVPISTGVLANDMDADFDVLTAQLVTSPASGSLMLNANGSFTYFASPSFSGTASFTYRAFDGTQTGNTATVSIIVTAGGGGTGGGGSAPGGGGSTGGGTNHAPVANADSFWVEQNSSLAKLPTLWNDSDPDNNVLSISAVGTPLHGSASAQYTTGPVVGYSPTSGYTGSDTFSYTISDGSLTASANSTLTVHQVDNTIAQARSLSLQNNVRMTTGGIIGDGPQSWSDVDLFSLTLSAGQILKVDLDAAAIDGGGSFGSFDGYLRLFNSSGTQVAFNNNGTDPDTGVAGNDSYLTYSVTVAGTYYIGVSDSTNTTYNPSVSGGGYSFSGGAYQLKVLQEVPNSPPVAVNDSATTHHGTAITIPVLGNDSDPNGDAISLASVGSASHGTPIIFTESGVQKIRYTPVAGYVGPDAFTYTITDALGATASATVSLTVSNNNPTAIMDSYEAVAGVSRGVSAGGGVLANDADADGDPLTAVLVSGVGHGALSLNANGSFTYTAASGFQGTDSFVYRATDGAGTSPDVTVTISVYPSNVTGFPESYSIGHNKTLTLAAPGVLANDWDFEHQSLSAVLVAAPTHGSLTLNGDGSFSYTPVTGFVGSDVFVFRASDGVNQSASITVPITVTNFAPWSVNDYYTVSHDRSLIRTATNGLLANDIDVEGDSLSVSLVSGPATGTLILNTDGSFTFSPATATVGTVTFSYRVTDGFNWSQNSTATLAVGNSAPVASPDWFYTSSGQPLTMTRTQLLSNDSDADNDTLSMTVQTGPSHGTLTVQAGGDLLYQPDPGFSGSDSFSYIPSDGLAAGTATTVVIKVSNHSPIGIADFYNVSHDRPLLVSANGLIQNDIDDDGDSLTVVLESAPTSGSLMLNSDGTFIYAPAANALGDVTFSYRVSDGIAMSEPITATIRITNAAPVGRSDAYQLQHDASISISAERGLRNNDTDADTDVLSVALHAGPSHGTVNLSSDGSFSYVPSGGYTGTDHFTYCLTDGLVTSDPITVSLTVSNIRPGATSDRYSVVHDRSLSVPASTGVLSNDFDTDTDALTAVLTTSVLHGTITLYAAGGFTYVPAAGFVGTDSFSYRSFDGAEYSDPVAVTIGVSNLRPWTVDRSFTVMHDRPVTVDSPGLFAFAGDGDSDQLTVSTTTAPSHGALTLSANGAFTYTPAAGYVGTDQFTYRVSDGVSLSDVQTVSLQVFNRVPILRSDSYVISHDRILTVTSVAGLLANDLDLDGDQLSVALLSGQGPAHGTLTLQTSGSFIYTPTAGMSALIHSGIAFPMVLRQLKRMFVWMC